VALALVTVAAVVFAVINFEKEGQYLILYDASGGTKKPAVWWQARRRRGPGDKAGIKVGDRLLAINNQPQDCQYQAETASLGRRVVQATYELERHGVKVEASLVILAPVDSASLHLGPRLIALIYLGIGFYVLFAAGRRRNHPFLCFLPGFFRTVLVHYTGSSTFDSIILWSNVVAGLTPGAFFLHFALTFPETRKLLVKAPVVIGVIYLAGSCAAWDQKFGFTREASEACSGTWIECKCSMRRFTFMCRRGAVGQLSQVQYPIATAADEVDLPGDRLAITRIGFSL